MTREWEERERARDPRRLKRRSQSHVAAAMLHLDYALAYFREHDRRGGIQFLKILRALKPYSINPDEANPLARDKYEPAENLFQSASYDDASRN